MFQEDFCWTNVFFCNKRAAIYLKTFYLLSILFSLIYRQFSLIFPLSPHSLFLSFHCRAFFSFFLSIYILTLSFILTSLVPSPFKSLQLLLKHSFSQFPRPSFLPTLSLLSSPLLSLSSICSHSHSLFFNSS